LSRRPRADLAIEWSAKEVAIFDGNAGTAQTYPDLKSVPGISGKSAIVGISRRALFLRTTRVPDADAGTVGQILAIRAGELFPVSPGDVAVDFIILDDVGPEGRLALVAAIRIAELRQIRSEAKEAGITILRVVPVALGAALVARSTGHTSGAVVSREANGFGIDIVAGGDLRHSRSVALTAPLEAEVCRTFSVAGIPCSDVLIGPGVEYPDVAIALGKSPLEGLLGEWPESWNLDIELPEDAQARAKAEVRARLRNALLFAIAAVAFLALVATEYSDRVTAVRQEVSRAETEVRKLEAIKREAEAEATLQKGYLQSLDRAFNPAQPLGDVLSLVANQAPKDLWLTGVGMERGKPVTIRGTALSGAAVTNYVNRLTAQDRLRDVKLVFANNGVLEDQPVVQFSITAFPVGNIPVVESNRRRTTSR
jgi:Tfp pilus assembly protein PilN